MTDWTEQRARLERFTKGESGYAVYPGGIFMTDGPSPFYEDLRAALSRIDTLEAELAGANEHNQAACGDNDCLIDLLSEVRAIASGWSGGQRGDADDFKRIKDKIDKAVGARVRERNRIKSDEAVARLKKSPPPPAQGGA